MVEIKDAVAKAIQFASNVLGSARTTDVRLEEVDVGQHKGADVWLITLSMPHPHLSEVFGGRRDFKTFTVHKETGEVLSMKIRELSGA